MAITMIGREKGYPKSKWAMSGKKIVSTPRDRYKLIVNSEADYDESILFQLPFQIGVYFPNSNARLKDIGLDRDTGNRLLWYLDLSYTTAFDDESDEDKDKPPDQRRPEWAWDFETLPRVMTVDVDKQPIATSAGDPIEVEHDIVIPVLTIERFERTFDPDTIITYMNRVNESAFWGAPVGAALMAGIRDRKDASEVFQGVAYRRVTYVVKFALPHIPEVLEGWRLLLVDHGWHKLVDGEKKPIFDNGARVSRNLNGSGVPLVVGAPPNILQFVKHKEANFDALGINWGQF